MQKKTIILIIVITLLLVGGGVYWWWGNQQPKDVIPEGVQVEIQDGKKVIKNEPAGYEIEVPKDWIIYGDNAERLKIFKTIGANPTNSEAIKGCKIDVSQESFEMQSLDEWLQKKDQERLKDEKNEPSSTQLIEENYITLINRSVIERTYEPPIGPIYKEIYLPLEEKILILRRTIGITSIEEKQECEEQMEFIVENLSIL